MSKVLAVLVSDIHLSHTPPVARSAEPDWYAAQKRVLLQLQGIVDQAKAPLIICGDLFHRFDPPPELINFAIQFLSKAYAIPGQHDLPMHRYEDIDRSAYMTLVRAGVIVDLGKNPKCIELDDGPALWLHPFPWGVEPSKSKAVKERNDSLVDLAVCHHFIYTGPSNSFPGAPKESFAPVLAEKLAGYNAAAFGDNHIGFQIRLEGKDILNCGCLIRRRSNERKLRPFVGLLYADGLIEREYLDCSEDLWLDEVEMESQNFQEEDSPELEAFAMELKGIETEDSLDFEASVRSYVSNSDNGVSGDARSLLLEVLEKCR